MVKEPLEKNPVEELVEEVPVVEEEPEEVYEEESSWETPSNIDEPIYAPKVETQPEEVVEKFAWGRFR